MQPRKEKKHLSFKALRESLGTHLQQIPDERQTGKINYQIHDALMSGFACMYFQDPSLLQFQKRLDDEYQNNNLKTLFSVSAIPKETQMRELIDKTDSEAFRPIYNDYFSRLQRSKHLEEYQLFPGLYLAPMDATQYYQSNKVHCDKCLTKNRKSGVIDYSHQALQISIIHPNMKQVIPLMPEEIRNEDGNTKQDCEMNAAKRLLPQLRKDHRQLGLIIGGDGLYSKQPIIEQILDLKMHYIFVAKPDDHTYMMEWLAAYPSLHTHSVSDSKGRVHHYRWMNDVPLNGNDKTVNINYFYYEIIGKDKRGEDKIVYKNSWVTDLTICETTIIKLVAGGRCRWKIENECFNTLKNQGYALEHSYGHGKENLCFNFYLLTLLAFYFHQIFELTDITYQACRKKFGSKRYMWETLRVYIRLLIFGSWQQLMEFALKPRAYIPEDKADVSKMRG